MESDVVTVAKLNIKILKIYLLNNTAIFVFICDNFLILAQLLNIACFDFLIKKRKL